MCTSGDEGRGMRSVMQCVTRESIINLEARAEQQRRAYC